MCDTLVAPPHTTARKAMLFAKNSDRQRNEAQALEQRAAAIHDRGERLRCTYIEIEQSPRTHAVLLSRPFWIWGAEMGANEHGVVIGNEGVHSRAKPSEDPALVGMDLVRLGLERGASAAESLEIITTLLERHGQGGNCGHLRPAYYNNSFLIADPVEAYVLETIDRDWVAERTQGIRGISNHYSITTAPTLKSSGIDARIENEGWPLKTPVDYTLALANPQSEHIGQSRSRRAHATARLERNAGALEIADMMAALRDHRAEASRWDPRSAKNIGICMHAGAHDAQTTGAWASELGQSAVHWVTGTSSPCLSIFKPALVGTPLPDQGPWPTGRFDAASPWWRHERFYRMAIMTDLPRVLADFAPERDALEAEFRKRIAALSTDPQARTECVARCWADATDLEARWHARLADGPLTEDSEFNASWVAMNARASIPLLNSRAP